MNDIKPENHLPRQSCSYALKDGSWWKVRRKCLTFHSAIQLTPLEGNITWKVIFGKFISPVKLQFLG